MLLTLGGESGDIMADITKLSEVKGQEEKGQEEKELEEKGLDIRMR